MDFMRPLGRTGLTVSALGLGTVKIGRNQGVRYPSGFELPTDEQAADVLRSAADFGINLIDTAPAYGSSEERLGEILSRHGWFGGRGRWILSTKVGEEFDGELSRFDFSRAGVTASIERSLRRLRVDALDLVLIHSSGDDEEILRHSGAVEALNVLKGRGLVRGVGISSKSVAGGMLALAMGLDVLMVTLNANESDQLPVILEAGKRGAGVLIKKGLASGHAAVGAARGGGDPVRDAMSFIFDRGGSAVSSVVVGTINTGHLRQNIEIARDVIGSRDRAP